MKIFKITTLIVALFVLGVSLCLTASLVKAEDDNQENVNELRLNNNENRDIQNENNNRNENENENINDNENENVNANEDSEKKLNGAEHRSAVANFVQKLLDAANREKGGIGDQVKAIAQAQNDTIEQESQAIDKINSRNKITTFLIGSDYKNLGMLRSQMVATQNQIDQLTRLLAQTTDPTTKATLQAQIQVLTQEQQKINDFIKIQDSKFSLFGWLVKLFVK